MSKGPLHVLPWCPLGSPPGVSPHIKCIWATCSRQRPYHGEHTSSRLITEVKQRWAGLVLGWVTAWEPPVPLAPFSARLGKERGGQKAGYLAEHRPLFWAPLDFKVWQPVDRNPGAGRPDLKTKYSI